MFQCRQLAPSDLPAFRALHDASLEVVYDDAFYSTLHARRDREGHALLSYAALDAATGALIGGLSVRLAPSSAPAAADAGAAAPWSWSGLLLPLRILSRALRALWRGTAGEAGNGGEGAGGGGAPLVAYIMTLCVAPAARRRGVARALMQTLLADLQGGAPPRCAALELHMLEGNDAATRLYTSLGFVVGARQQHYYYFAGSYHDALLWRRALPEAGGGEGGTCGAAQGGAEALRADDQV
jgi:GNAT superfamily N-acetyltransferase